MHEEEEGKKTVFVVPICIERDQGETVCVYDLDPEGRGGNNNPPYNLLVFLAYIHIL